MSQPGPSRSHFDLGMDLSPCDATESVPLISNPFGPDFPMDSHCGRDIDHSRPLSEQGATTVNRISNPEVSPASSDDLSERMIPSPPSLSPRSEDTHAMVRIYQR